MKVQFQILIRTRKCLEIPLTDHAKYSQNLSEYNSKWNYSNNGQLFVFYFYFQFICINTLFIHLYRIYVWESCQFSWIHLGKNFHRILLSQIFFMWYLLNFFPSVKTISILKYTLYYQDRLLGLILDIDLFLNFHINSSPWHIHSIFKII